MKSTIAQHGGRTYNRQLFGLPDRMMWVVGVTDFERAQELEDWGMEVIAEVYPDFCVNKNGSCLSKKCISLGQPNGCYFQPVRPYSGGIRDFERERREARGEAREGRCFADLGKRFNHTYGI